MTLTVNIHEAKTQFSKLLLKVSQGEEIIIARGGQPIARLVAITNQSSHRKPGSAIGQLEIMPDFDVPLPDEILENFGL